MSVNIDAIHFKKPPYKRIKPIKNKQVIKEKIKYKDEFGIEWIVLVDKPENN